MKLLFTLLPLWFLACVACAVNTLEQGFLCPVCGTHWQQRIETSGLSRGLRLDLRQLGDVVDPPTLPQCTKCRFPLFSDRLAAQANDPTKEKAFKRLRSFVTGADFQLLASKNPSYFTLAQVQELLEAPHRHIALSYLRASWQVEGREAACRRLLEKALTHYVAALDGMDVEDRLYGDLSLICGEVERRLGKWAEAEKRFRALNASRRLDGTPQAFIPTMQLRLIEQHDSAPHALQGPDLAESHPRPSPEVRMEEPPPIFEAAARVEKAEGGMSKLESPPKASEEPLPIVLLEAPMPIVLLEAPMPPMKPEPVPLDLPDGGTKPDSQPLPPDELLPTVVMPRPTPPVRPHPARIGKPPGAVKPGIPPKPPEELPVAVLPLLQVPTLPLVPPPPPAAPVKPESNFSDNPD